LGCGDDGPRRWCTKGARSKNNFSLVVQGEASTIPFGDGAVLGVWAADKDGLLDGHGEVINGLGFAADVLLQKIDAEEAGGSGFCEMFLCSVVPTPSE
jgi:hypothetical protein